MYVYKTKGTCSRAIEIEVEGDTIKTVNFIGGCAGNTQGVARLAEGMKVDEAIAIVMASDSYVEGSLERNGNFFTWETDDGIRCAYSPRMRQINEELTPEAPLILDDALVRFDDQRMEAAVEILREMAQTKQVICFTCQGREAQI